MRIHKPIPLERVLHGRNTPLRSLGGVALALAGVVALVARGVRVAQLPAALAALAMALAGTAVLVGPVHRPADNPAARRGTRLASAIRSATTWPHICTTRCCRPWR